LAREAFDRLAAGIARVRGRAQNSVLSVSVLPSFAAKWLMPRLPRFLAAHPEVDLRVSAFERLVKFGTEDVDLGVRLGNGRWPGMHAVLLMDDEIFPVCSPRLLASLRRPRDLARANFIHMEGHNKWSEWLEKARVPGVDLSRGVVF